VSNTLAYLLVLTTILLTAYGQLVLKWQVLRAGSLPSQLLERLHFVGQLLLNPWVLSAFAAAFLASLSWMLAMSKLQISRAYPVTALTFVIVVIGGGILFSEAISTLKVVGLALVVIGIVVGAQG
jgi:multidrug transporter EmrE-like cation transporter